MSVHVQDPLACFGNFNLTNIDILWNIFLYSVWQIQRVICRPKLVTQLIKQQRNRIILPQAREETRLMPIDVKNDHGDISIFLSNGFCLCDALWWWPTARWGGTPNAHSSKKSGHFLVVMTPLSHNRVWWWMHSFRRETWYQISGKKYIFWFENTALRCWA